MVACDQRGPAQVRYVYVAAEVPADLSIPFSDRAIEGELQLDLPEGDYLTYWFAPETGRYFGWQSYTSTGRLSLGLPGTTNDVVAVIKAAS